jgi:hypothetical protein
MAKENKDTSRRAQIHKETAERRAYIRKNQNDFSPEGRVFILVGGKLPLLHLEGWYFTTVAAALKHARHFAGKEDHLKIEVCLNVREI